MYYDKVRADSLACRYCNCHSMVSSCAYNIRPDTLSCEDLGIINYPSELKTSMLAHIIKITVCYDRAELGLSIKLSYFDHQI